MKLKGAKEGFESAAADLGIGIRCRELYLNERYHKVVEILFDRLEVFGLEFYNVVVLLRNPDQIMSHNLYDNRSRFPHPSNFIYKGRPRQDDIVAAVNSSDYKTALDLMHKSLNVSWERPIYPSDYYIISWLKRNGAPVVACAVSGEGIRPDLITSCSACLKIISSENSSDCSYCGHLCRNCYTGEMQSYKARYSNMVNLCESHPVYFCEDHGHEHRFCVPGTPRYKGEHYTPHAGIKICYFCGRMGCGYGSGKSIFSYRCKNYCRLDYSKSKFEIEGITNYMLCEYCLVDGECPTCRRIE